ncbi:type II toxin-antitoxin system ParD family antitoxin [Leifsonia sp. NPDC056665]|uniref:type II toxin-antitoxin system ParD family antitoxin n=1 Tax=Leifsonia sp. NPDC056665 TaxID=3345901 RepID=UPI0036A0B2DA
MTGRVFREPRTRLRLPEHREARMSALRAALMAADESGEPVAFDFDAFIAAKKSRNGHL